MQTSTRTWSEQKRGEQRVRFWPHVETDAPQSLRQKGSRNSSEPSTHFTEEEIEQRVDMGRVTQCMMTGNTGTTIPCSILRCPLDRTFSLFLIHSLFYGHPGVSWDTLLKVDHLRGCRASVLCFPQLSCLSG